MNATCLQFEARKKKKRINHTQINFNSTTALFHFPHEKFDSNSLIDKLHQFEMLRKVMWDFLQNYISKLHTHRKEQLLQNIYKHVLEIIFTFARRQATQESKRFISDFDEII